MACVQSQGESTPEFGVYMVMNSAQPGPELKMSPRTSVSVSGAWMTSDIIMQCERPLVISCVVVR